MVGKNPKSKLPARRPHYENLKPSDIVCPVCRTIFVEPVTLPCNHVFCRECFEDTMENVTLGCPLCRNRVGSWVRTAKKAGTFINKEFWEAIQSQYSKALQNKLNGFDNDFELEEPVIIVACPGDIRKEYEKEKKKVLEEQNKTKAEEEIASTSLIEKLSQEEAHKNQIKEEELKRDELLARKLHEELNTPSTSRRPRLAKKAGPMDRYVKNKAMSQKNSNPTKHSPVDQNPKKLFVDNRKLICSSSGDNSDSDIIDQECRYYFKPIDLNKKHHKPGKVPLKVSAVKGLENGKKCMRPPSGEKPILGHGQTAFARFISGLTEESGEEIMEKGKQKVSSEKELLPSTSEKGLVKTLKRKSSSFDNTKLPKKRTMLMPCNAKQNNNSQIKTSISPTVESLTNYMPTRRSRSIISSQESSPRFKGFSTQEMKESEEISNFVELEKKLFVINNVPPEFNVENELNSIKKPKENNFSIDINRNIPKSTNGGLNNSTLDSINGEINGLSPESPVINNIIGKKLIQFNKHSENSIILDTPPGDFDSSDSEEDVVLSNLIDSFCKSKLEDSAANGNKRAKRSPKKVPLPKAGTSKLCKNVKDDSKCNVSPEEKKRKRQEVDDFALAKKLQAEFDKMHVLSTTRRGTRRRQVTLDEMLTV